MTLHKTITTRATKVSGFLGLQQSTVGVLAMVVLVGMGERMAECFLPIYIGTWRGSAGHRAFAGNGQPALGPLLVSRRLPIRPYRNQAFSYGI